MVSLRDAGQPSGPYPIPSRHHTITPQLQDSRTPGLHPPDEIKITSKIKIKKGQGCSRVGHGLSRVVSRVGREKRPVIIRLSRCHGSNPLRDRNYQTPASPRGFGAASQHRPSLGSFGPAGRTSEEFQCPNAKKASVASWRLCVKCGRDGETSRASTLSGRNKV